VPNPVVRTSREQLPEGPLVFGFLGRLTRDKGIATLVDAFANASVPEGTRLIIGGDGPLRDALEARASAHVELLGWLDDSARERFYDRIDALVVPSEWKDPAPLVVNEARARNIPIIGARIGGIPELISPSSRRFLFNPGDERELAQRLGEFTRRDPAVPADPGNGLLTWDEHLEQVSEAYETARDSASRRR
jgi:glycosyltransferase involved in cell wall biosynthesis